MSSARDSPHRRAPRVLFLIENVPYSLDSRVRREAGVVEDLGGQVVVICPSDGSGWYKCLGNVFVYQYPKPRLGGRFEAHLIEYACSLLFHTLLTAVVYVRHGFDVIHGANPPDIFWLVAAPYKLLGKTYIFDHHDLVPELFRVRYGRRLGALHRVILWMERRGLRLADHVVTTNESFRAIALERGSRRAEDVTIVRNGPWLERDFVNIAPDESVRGTAKVVVGYLGIMNPQDHLENLLEAARIVRKDLGRTDIAFLLIGSGDAYADLCALRDGMGLHGAVDMPGTLPWTSVVSKLAAVDFCVQPDLPTGFNVHLTMNKLMEYMALGKPSVAYDMPETRVTGGDAVVYVAEPSPRALAHAIVALADDPERRARLGADSFRRVKETLSWEQQRESLVSVYRRITTTNESAGLRAGLDP